MSERSLAFTCPADDGVSAVHAALAELWEEEPRLGSWDRMSFETALIELTSNAVQHARSDRPLACSVTIEIAESEMRAVLSDSGDAVEVDISRAREMPDEWADAGRGIPFIQALVTEFGHRRVDGGNVWTISRTRRRSG